MDEDREPIFQFAERVNDARRSGELRRWAWITFAVLGGFVLMAYLYTPRFW